MSWICDTKKACPNCATVQHFMRKTCTKCGVNTQFRDEIEQKRASDLEACYEKGRQASVTRNSVNRIKKQILKYMAQLEGAGSKCVLFIVGKEPAHRRCSLMTYNKVLGNFYYTTDSAGDKVLNEKAKATLEGLKRNYLSALNRFCAEV